MRAIIVCVDFADLLSVTLTHNRHHFEAVTVVTHPDDEDTKWVASHCNAGVFETTLFYDRGATFNKFSALEAGLDYIGRSGWLCLMDADVVWPSVLPEINWQCGKLYGPPRRIMETIKLPVPPEDQWYQFRVERNSLRERPGYSQIFHADDPHLGPTPWHETNWAHAGRADSFFNQKWPRSDTVLLPFQALHLGRNGQDWCGRVSPYLDGTVDPQAETRAKAFQQFKSRGRGAGRWEHERI